MNICRQIKARGKVVQAQHTKTTIGGVYRWGIAERLVKHNPAKEVGNQQPAKSIRKRSPSASELGSLWRATGDAARLSPSMCLIIRIAILTGQRRTEVAGARVSELAGLETERPEWRIPGDVTSKGRIIEGRTKNGRDQHVYLRRSAKITESCCL